MKPTLWTLVPLVILFTCGSAQTVLDFEGVKDGNPVVTLQTGEIIEDQFLGDWGVAIESVKFDSGTGDFIVSPYPAVIFDTANPTGGDTDLATPGAGGTPPALGNVLIVHERKTSTSPVSNPDDKASGSTIRFTFQDPVIIDQVGLLDLDDGSTSASLAGRALDGSLIGSFSANPFDVAGAGDNSYQVVTLPWDSSVRMLDVDFSSSGAVAFVSWNVIPEPAEVGAASLLALAGMLVLRKRSARRTKS